MFMRCAGWDLLERVPTSTITSEASKTSSETSYKWILLIDLLLAFVRHCLLLAPAYFRKHFMLPWGMKVMGQYFIEETLSEQSTILFSPEKLLIVGKYRRERHL